MSYCRWSNDHFECDVYVYESNDGWVTHVAGRRRKHLIPDEIKSLLRCEADEFPQRYLAYDEAVAEWEKDIPEDDYWEDLPESIAGKTYTHSSPGECVENLLQLQVAGARVPQYAIDNLKDEQKDIDDHG